MVLRLLLVVACNVVDPRLYGTCTSVVAARGLGSCGSWALEYSLSSCGTQAQLLHGLWDLPRPGTEPMSPTLAGGFLSTEPPGKPNMVISNLYHLVIFFFKLSVMILLVLRFGERLRR